MEGGHPQMSGEHLLPPGTIRHAAKPRARHSAHTHSSYGSWAYRGLRDAADAHYEPKPEATFIPEEKSKDSAEQVCEPPITSVPVGVFVELDIDKCLIDHEKEVVLPTLPTHGPLFTPSSFR